MIALEACCTKCGETFNPEDENDLVHLVRSDGEPCGGDGDLVGGWSAGVTGFVHEVPATDVKVGMTARPVDGPAFLFQPRPDFARVTSVVADGGWVKVRFADGSGCDVRESNGALEVQD